MMCSPPETDSDLPHAVEVPVLCFAVGHKHSTARPDFCWRLCALFTLASMLAIIPRARSALLAPTSTTYQHRCSGVRVRWCGCTNLSPHETNGCRKRLEMRSLGACTLQRTVQGFRTVPCRTGSERARCVQCAHVCGWGRALHTCSFGARLTAGRGFEPACVVQQYGGLISIGISSPTTVNVAGSNLYTISAQVRLSDVRGGWCGRTNLSPRETNGCPKRLELLGSTPECAGRFERPHGA